MIRRPLLRTALLAVAASCAAVGCGDGTEIAGASSNPGGQNNQPVKDTTGGNTTDATGDSLAQDASTVDVQHAEDPYWKTIDLEGSTVVKDLHGYQRPTGEWVLAVAGDQGAVALYTEQGTEWRNLGVVDNFVKNVDGIWAYDDNTIFVAGDGFLRRWDSIEGKWTDFIDVPTLPIPEFGAIYGTGPGDVYAVGAAGAFWHYFGAADKWEVVVDIDGKPLSESTIDDIYVEPDGTVYAVSGKTIIWGKASAFSWQKYDTTATLKAVRGVAPGNAFAVGFSAQIPHLIDGNDWIEQSSNIATNGFADVWGWAPDNALAIGLNKTLVRYHQVGGIVQWDPVIVEQEDEYAITSPGSVPKEDKITPYAYDLNHLYGFGADNIFIAVTKASGGDGPELLHYYRHAIE